MSGEKWELSHPIHTYCPETTTPIWEHIEGTHPSSRLTAAFWGGGIDEEVMMDLPVPPFLRKKCYRALIVRILKEAHKRWKQRNTQLLQSGNLTDYEWTPSKLAHKTPPPSPNKRKRDIQWTNNRLVETRMQHILHDYIHKPIPRPPNTTPHSDTDSGGKSGGTKHIEEVGILEGGAVVGRSGGTVEFLQGSRGPSSDIGPGRGFLGRAGSGGKGTGGGIGGRGGKASRARRAAEEPLASATVSTVIPPRAGKRKRHTETRIDCQRRLTRRRGDTNISHSALHTNTAHDRHTGIIQPLQYTDCTTGQAHCTVVGMEIIQSNQL